MKKVSDPSLHLSTNPYFPAFTSDAPVRKLGVTFDRHLSFHNHISNRSRSRFLHLRDFRRIWSILDFKTTSTTAASIVHSKLDYCISLFLNLDSPK